MKTLLLLFCLLADSSWLESALFLEGLSSAEELPASLAESYEQLAANPLPLNYSSAQELVSSGLFTDYQAACVLDYRSRMGNIMSVAELSAVDGISLPLAKALSCFVSLESGGEVMQSASRLHARLTAKSAWKESLGGAVNMSLDYARWSCGAALKSGSSLPAFSLSGPVGRKGLRVYAGSLRARFGQGVAVGSGISMTSLRTADSFSRPGSGLSRSASWSGDNCLWGIGASCGAGRTQFSALLTADGTLVGNCRHNFSSASIGVTGYGGAKASCVALDGIATLGRVTFFADAAYSWGPALLCGLSWRPAYGSCVSILYRDYSAAYSALYAGAFRSFSSGKDERALSVAANRGPLSFTSDFAGRPVAGNSKQRARLQFSRDFRLGAYTLGTLLRASGTWSSSSADRRELRGELSFGKEALAAGFRADLVQCPGQSPAFCMLVDLRASTGNLSLYARAGLFRVDKWDSRIYVYERDLPGNFTVPALYGQGCIASLYVSWGVLRLRAATTQYVWMDKKPAAELKMALVLKI